METLPHWINGREQSGKGDVFNPATGEVQKQVPYASVDEVDAAVGAASKALESWRRLGNSNCDLTGRRD